MPRLPWCYRVAVPAMTAALLASAVAMADVPRTTAETSNYTATTRHADVVAFCAALAQQSPVVRHESLGVSGEGRSLPLLILSEPAVKSPVEARKSGKPVVLLVGNIHAGEVDGKEALMMLARDIALGADRALLKDVIVLMVPIFNADGNEKMAKGKRAEQGGPDEVGDRENSGGLDLNRDFVKLESPEVRALVHGLRQWEPAVVMDMHTTNGSHHRHTLTYDGPRHPGAPARALADKLILAAAARLRAATGFVPFVYGNFSADRKVWETYPTQPRYGVQYVGLRGAVSVLSESYSYAPYADRVRASLEFARGVCQEAAARKDELKKLGDLPRPERVALRTKLTAEDATRTVLGYRETVRDGKRERSDEHQEYQVRFGGRVEPTLEVALAPAYLVPAGFPEAIANLQRHGIPLQELREDIELDVEVDRVLKVERRERPFQGHRLVRLESERRKEGRLVKAGTVIVRTDHKLGTLASLLLEPMSEDGLATWNYFDAGLKDGGDFPVLRWSADVPVTSGPVRPLAAERVFKKPIDLKLVYGGGPPPSFAGNPVGGLTWLDDGEHFLQSKGGKLWRVHARTGRMSPFIDVEKVAASLTAAGLDKEPAKSLSTQQPGRGMDPKRVGMWVDHKGERYFARFDGTKAVKIPKAVAQGEHLTFSPDGTRLAFVRAGNLHMYDLSTGEDRAITSDGGGNILNGKADWVYYEEVFDRNGRAFWWSDNSQQIAFLRFDDGPVKEFAVVNHMPTQLNVERTRYPKSGDPNPLVKLAIADLNDKSVETIEFPEYKPDDMLVTHVGWRSGQCYCYVQNRIQTFLDVWQIEPVGAARGRGFVTPASTHSKTRKLFRDTTGAWIEPTGPLHMLPDGSFLFVSDKSGWRHLYHHRADGTLTNAVTQGEWEVRKVDVIDPDGAWVCFTGTRDSHRAVNLYCARVDGSAITRITTEPGVHAASVNKLGTMFVDTYSTPNEPTKVTLRTAGGELIRTLDTNPVYSREEYEFGNSEAVQVKTTDGFVLEGLLIYPPDFDANKKYPVWMKTYAGPHAPTVSDAFAGGRVGDQALAKLGIVVFHVDPRAASGKGAQSSWTSYKKLGVQELKDLESAVDWVCEKPWADAKRIGLSGHSFGGYITAYALTHSKKFCAGIAGAPVTDWRLYDSIYTERYMGLPKENKEGYDASSVVKAARNLHGRLLIVHGLMDDNVHVQNSVQLINALQQADKDFEVMVYPQARHGIGGRHYQRQLVNFMTRSLGIDARLPPRERE